MLFNKIIIIMCRVSLRTVEKHGWVSYGGQCHGRRSITTTMGLHRSGRWRVSVIAGKVWLSLRPARVRGVALFCNICQLSLSTVFSVIVLFSRKFAGIPGKIGVMYKIIFRSTPNIFFSALRMAFLISEQNCHRFEENFVLWFLTVLLTHICSSIKHQIKVIVWNNNLYYCGISSHKTISQGFASCLDGL